MRKEYRELKKSVWNNYRKQGRDLPWRKTNNPYYILVSEIMLQQTQVARVLVKYPEFIKAFPTLRRLAQVPLAHVLRVWQGMGYNRRAIALKKIAQVVVKKHNGIIPSDPELLVMLPGIGRATAGSIAAFAFNKPVSFVETNIRRVYIYHCFPKKHDVKDEDIMKAVEETVDKRKAKEWYNALMDYGTYLAKHVENPNRKSRYYSKQAKFEGSNRQLRGKIIKAFAENEKLTEKDLQNCISIPLKSLRINITALLNEGFLEKKRNQYSLSRI